MLSILIPVYNYDIVPLVIEIHKQVTTSDRIFEILAYDDGSDPRYNAKNKAIKNLKGCTFKELPNNIGRSAIRNLLASEANYELLLFIDAGTFPKHKNFISNYLKEKSNTVVTGGMTCLSKTPKKPYKLRWLYTQKRESINNQDPSKNATIICSSNFLIRKEIFETVQFDESLKKYGCEDVVFFDEVLKQGISIKYINNPVIHDAGDDSYAFMKKTEQAVENLVYLISSNKIDKNRYKVSKIYHNLNRLKLDTLVAFIFSSFKKILLINLNSSYPSILLYDFYRLGYFCLLKTKN
ncbi:glycosyltransferase family 2 protein [Aquimarina sp. 2201CG5-10]|uniref:glycosyltransferase family 2 protein n=1 Tax=Aquimarina callyspongiae TaxID=3098150 RepID=UPI002AB3714E|nr:glycosyltransferase [Aquimarina sp. 2201CG5-10]MDY8138553.1 glycosyltransferase [Aquimarina sp. 2201CG5-10]